ncbi:MAG: YraN family protein [Actinobacteria bacterium]|nr:YraN family protein [Actinomycetes bacterium]MCX6506752.1 YraN family protein [Actinomycetota bacterium]
MTAGRRALGSYGENLAARWYEEHGFVVVDRNWRCREGEIDLVLTRARLLVFCEVKTRSSDAYGSPAAAVTPAKQVRLRKLGMRWIDAQQVRPASIRFDVACVIGRNVSVIESAF